MGQKINPIGFRLGINRVSASVSTAHGTAAGSLLRVNMAIFFMKTLLFVHTLKKNFQQLQLLKS